MLTANYIIIIIEQKRAIQDESLKIRPEWFDFCSMMMNGRP
jgi:hypothetical protein